MDNKLLESLNNLSLALVEISEALKSKDEPISGTAKALKGGDFIQEIKEINVGVKQLRKDTKQILNNQQTIMKMGKSSINDSRINDIEGLGKNKESQKNFKDGLGVVLLIAAAVLSLGIAFNLIGKVNFLSVISLSIALPLLAIGFAKVHKTLKDVGFDAKKDSINFIMAISSISISITLSSFILSALRPITLSQSITAIFISAMFVVISHNISKLLKSFEGMDRSTLVKSSIFLPLILPAISLSISLSSHILSNTKPITLYQSITAILIAATFSAIAFGLHKLIGSFKDFDTSQVLVASAMIPILLVAISYAISMSSKAFSEIKPISFTQFFVAVGISIVFTIISFGLKFIIDSIGEMELDDVIKIPTFMVIVSIAISASSHILSTTKVIDPMKLLNIVLFSISLSISILSIAITMKIMSSLKVGPEDALIGSVLIIAISISIMASSLILSLGNYNKYPDWKWAIGVGLSLIAFTPAIVLLGAISMSGIGAVAILAGAGMVLVVAASIADTSMILSLGNYKKYPPILWSLGVVSSLLPFTLMTIALGVLAITGVGLKAFYAGISMISTLAETIVNTSHILSKGKYDNKGMLNWAISTTMLYAAFTPILLILGAVGIASEVADFFGPNPWDKAREMILQIAETIVGVSFILSKGTYSDGPTKSWAEGISLTLGAFSPIYGMLLTNGIMKIFGSGEVGPDEFSSAIRTISQGIVDSALFFNNNKSSFKEGPSKKWADGVGTAIGAFAPVYQILSDNSGWMSSGVSVDDMVNAILSISKGIITAAYFFSINKAPFDDGNYPSKKWGEGVGSALSAFAPVFKSLSEDSGWFTSGESVVNDMKNAILTISGSLVGSAWMFSKVSPNMWKSYPSQSWGIGIGRSIEGFLGIFKKVSKYGITPSSLSNMSKIIQSTVSSMVITARTLWAGRNFFNLNIDPKFMKKVSGNIIDYMNLINIFKNSTESKFDIFNMKKKEDPINNIAEGMVKIAKSYDILSKSVNNFASAINNLDGEKISMFRSLTGNIAVLSAMDSAMFSNMMTVLESRSGVFAKLLKVEGEHSGIGKTKSETAIIKSTNKSDKKNKIETDDQKLDKIIFILSNINKEISGLDEYLLNKDKNLDISRSDG